MPGSAGALAVAASGGRDSTALLHVAARAARTFGLEVHALHVHHGLVPAADGWLTHLQSQCERWARHDGLPVHFHASRLQGAPARGESVEAWARAQRYLELAAMAAEAGCGLVLLAHHRRDQAETWLLQALRGGGPAGLASMPASASRGGVRWARPWLGVAREAIDAYLQRHKLAFVDDASNADARFARNRLRSAVWPALTAAFPAAEAQLAASARRAAEAAQCLRELAAIDIAATVDDGVLQVQRWAALGSARRTQLLRAWLGGPEWLVQRLAAELPRVRSARWRADRFELRLHDGSLRRVPAPAVALRSPPFDTHTAPPAIALDLSTAGRHPAAGWQGAFVIDDVVAGGVSPARLRRALLHTRLGGERFQSAPASVPRSLKQQFQSRRVPAWERNGPLLFDGAADTPTLLFVAGLGIDARCIAAPGEPQLNVHWEPTGAD